MILWKDAILNRSQIDIDELNELLSIPYNERSEEQKERLLIDLKGAFNRSDMERLENNIQLLSDVLELNLETYHGKLPEIPTLEYFIRLANNVESIRSAYTIHASTPSTPLLPINNFKKVNDIEKILDDIHEILLSNFNYYCGDEIYLGDTTGLIL